MRANSRIAALALLVTVAVTAFAGGQDDDPAQRWQKLPPDVRARLEQRYREWQNLSPEQRKKIQERHEMLRRLRAHEVESLSHDEAERVAHLPQNQQREMVGSRLRERLREVRRTLLDQPDAGQGEQLSPEDFRARVRDRVREQLADLESDGVLQPGEAERIANLPPRELLRALQGVMRRRDHEDHARWMESLPPEERRRLEQLPPEEFFRELRRLRGDASPFPKRRDFDGPRRPHLPIQLIEGRLTPAELESLAGLEGRGRKERVFDLLRAKARAALSARGEDPGAVDGLEALPDRIEVMKLLRCIDPTFEPPRPDGRGEGHGEGRREGRGPRPPRGGDRDPVRRF